MKKDIATKEYFKKPEIAADIINYWIYGGELKVQPEQLQQMNPEEDLTLVGGKSLQKLRDLLIGVMAVEEDTIYVLIGLELQSDTHYAMPVRNLLYNAIQYERQVKVFGEDRKKLKGKEFLSGMSKDDKLIPVITLVVYLNPEPWDGPRCLMDMMDIEDEEVRKWVANYHLNLIEPHAMKEEDIEKLKTQLREILRYTKYTNNKDKLYQIVKNDSRMQKLDLDTANVINAITNSKLKLQCDEKEGVVNMCKAIEDMRDECWAEGKADALTNAVISLMETLNLSIDLAMDALQIPLEERTYHREKIVKTI